MAPRSWALWRAQRRVVALVVSVDVLAVLISVAATLQSSVTGSDLLRFSLLVAMSVTYLEVSRQVEQRRRLFLNTSSPTDMTSVWTFPAAILLPGSLIACLVAVVYLHLWFRAWRHGDTARAYRSAYVAASVVITCLAVSAMVSATGLRASFESDPASALVVLLLAVAMYPAVNTVLVATAILVSGGERRPAAYLGSASENVLEVTTLVLGGVTAALLVSVPWLAVIVLPAVYLLQHHALLRQLVQAATIDTKTDLLNATAWRLLAQRELERAERQGTPTAVLVIDMDRFKLVNDRYGHLAGDTALRAVAGSLADELRGYDAVGRFGGEEFVALLPGVGRQTAANVGERIRRRIGSLAVNVESRNGGTALVELTASIGVASASADSGQLDDLLRAADSALYAAKGDGRNAVRVAPDSAVLPRAS
jgi:diguanylate cyclase (GGDEF)-like protein